MKTILSILLVSSSCYGAGLVNGTLSPVAGSGGSSGISSNYTGVVNLTNRANVFGGLSFIGYGQTNYDYPFLAKNTVYGNNQSRYFYAYYRGFGVIGTNNQLAPGLDGDNYVICDVDSGGYGHIAIGCGTNGAIYLGDSAGNAIFPHDVTAATFTGSGSGLTGYASSLTAGYADYADSAGYADSADYATQTFDDFFSNYQSAGTAGQYLVSDGAGNGVWTTSGGGDLPPWIYSTYGSSNSLDMSSVAGAPSMDFNIGTIGYVEGEPLLRLALASGAIQYNFICRTQGVAIPFVFGSGISSSTRIFRPSSTTFQIDTGGSAEIAISTTGVVSINGLIEKPNVEISSATSGTVTATTTYWNDTVYLSSGSTITSITVALPSSTSVGQTFRIHSKSIVTALTVSGGSYLDSAVTSLIAGQTIAYQATTTGGAYIRIQ